MRIRVLTCAPVHSMKLASFRIEHRATWGIIADGHAIDIGAALGPAYFDLKAFIQDGSPEAARAKIESAPRFSLDAISFLPVIPNPEKIFCVGLNYEEHRKETGRAVVTRPTIFARFANTQTGHKTDIIRPRVSTNLDFEGELAIIIGKPGRYIAREKAFDHIAGYACYNDGSVRDWQHHTHQFTPGKNFPNTGGFGPWMVTPDEFTDLDARRITTRLNGDIVQQATFGEMIFDIPTLIEYCSSFNPLVPGDVIVTGTPGGVGVKRNPPLWMKPGDLVEVEIDGIGVLQNGIADEAELA
jgi:2-keto-4-pentenoate hydratase/2-oxohepta-3-ene-1,7-dioic acid hydratase in catechol pathway